MAPVEVINESRSDLARYIAVIADDGLRRTNPVNDPHGAKSL